MIPARYKRRLSALLGIIVLSVYAVAVTATTAAAAPVVPPETRTDCAGIVPIVVGSDDAAQSDIYSAVTLAGVLGTSCIVLAGPRNGAMPAAQRARLEAARSGGWIVGGTAAVPAAKTAGRDMVRLAGVDRWHTARLVGAVAADPDGDIDELTARTAPVSDEPVDTDGDGIPEPALPNQAYMAYIMNVTALIEMCGWFDSDRGGYSQCENPEDTQAIIRMKSDFFGCKWQPVRGLCEGWSLSQQWQTESRLACRKGWALSEPYVTIGAYSGFLCYHLDHPDYIPG